MLLSLAVGCTALAYLAGWRRLRSISSNAIHAWHLASCLLGLFLIWVAVASPVAALDAQWLTAHMAKHLLLMTIAPPLVLLGAPLLALWHGLPRPVANAVIGPLFRRLPGQRLGREFGLLAVCWIASTATIVGWHVPALFAVAMRSAAWHAVEQASFLATGFLFWWPVVRPWPTRHRVAAMVARSLLISRDAAVRHPFSFSGVLRTCRLSRVPLRLAAR